MKSNIHSLIIPKPPTKPKDKTKGGNIYRPENYVE